MPKAEKVKYKIARSGAISSSRNQPVGGSDISHQNVNDVILYESGSNTYESLFGDIKPENLLFVLFENPNDAPTYDYIPQSMPIITIDNETVFQVFDYTPTTKLTDGKKHNLLGVKYENAKYKLKMVPKPYTHLTEADREVGGVTGYFYIETYPGVESGNYDTYGNPIIVPTRWWGTMAINQPPDNTSFGKRIKYKKQNTLKSLNKDINYLRK